MVTTDDALELDDAALLGLVLAVDRLALLGHAADVERPHRQLRARLADRLGGDDADRHALLDERRRWPGPCRSSSRQTPSGAWQVIGLRTVILSSPSFSSSLALSGVIISFSSTITSPVVGLLDRLAADAAADRLGERPIDLVALVHDPLGDARAWCRSRAW